MRPTFYGFEAARSGLTAAQTGLVVTGNNIANLSTEAFSGRSSSQTGTYLGPPATSWPTPTAKTGGLAPPSRDINQVRSQFLDLRYRDANSEKQCQLEGALPPSPTSRTTLTKRRTTDSTRCWTTFPISCRCCR
jgi:flagellar hook-associated protein FlgK